MERLNTFLAEAATSVRAHFGGEVTYASGPWEPVEWGPFDLDELLSVFEEEGVDTALWFSFANYDKTRSA